MIKTLSPYMKKYGIYAVLCPLMVIGEVLLEIFIPLLMSKIVDIGIPLGQKTGNISYIVQTGALMIGMAMLALLFGAVAARFGAKAGMGFGSELRRGLFEKIQSFSFANIDKFSTASLVTRITTDVNSAQMSFMMVIRMLVRAPVMLVCATWMAFAINRSLVAVFLIAIPVLAIGFIVISSIAFPRFQAMLKKYDAMNGSVQENLISIRVVKAFVRAAHEKLKFHKSTEDLMQSSLRAEKVMIFSMPLMQLAMYACIVAILWFGGNMIIAGSMETGELISFITYVTQILMSLMMISMVFIMLVMSQASLKRIAEVLKEQPDITDAIGDGAVVADDGSVVFDHVSFKYDKNGAENTLDDISLSIKSGQTVGIIGGTGSAKTTLVQLIPRLYDVTEGRILVGGHDVRDYKLEDLRQAVGMVLQKNVLFSGTIRDNLKWGNADATDEEIIAACKAAQAYEFIMSFPDGFDTDLGQGGVNVSGGQKQRLCIARALLKKPKIIILDDSTSAVDTATDAKIRQAFSETFSNTTAIIIAQRITSICDADQIIVLDDGKIAGIGTHDELMETNEIYRDVYDSQQKGVA